MINQLNFNSRLRKETNLGSYIITFYLTYFNSRLRKETNGIVRIICGNDAISTHVSARRRTLRPVHPWDRMNISIHVSVGRRTARSILALYRPVNFNSRLRRETNAVHAVQLRLALLISTHVSVGRRTQSFFGKVVPTKISTHVSVGRRTAKRINMLDLYFLIEQLQQ